MAIHPPIKMGGLIAQIIMNEMFRYILKLAEELKGVIKDGLNDREEAGVIKSSSTPEKIAVIDPLDGTFNALHNLPFYSFSIALAKYSENATMEDVNYPRLKSWAS